jgi:fructokinase
MRLGIDLGGTKIEAAVLDDGGAIVWRERLPTPSTDYPAVLHAIAALIDRALQANGLPVDMPVGIGTPGSRSPVTGLMRNCNSTRLNDQPLLEDLQRQLQRPVRLANDADCFTLSEAVAGAACGARTVFGVILGTGVGGGIAINGQLLAGPNAIAGEWGHNPMPGLSVQGRPVRRCLCGRDNCVETWLCGPALQRSFNEACAQGLPVQESLRLANTGDACAQAVLQDYIQLLAQALSTVINILDPDVIVLGGGVSNVDAIYQQVPQIWAPWIFSNVIRTRLVKAQSGDSSGVIGAAWLWP